MVEIFPVCYLTGQVILAIDEAPHFLGTRFALPFGARQSFFPSLVQVRSLQRASAATAAHSPITRGRARSFQFLALKLWDQEHRSNDIEGVDQGKQSNRCVKRVFCSHGAGHERAQATDCPA